MHMKCDACFATHGRDASFVFEEERDVSRTGLVFNDVYVSKRQGTWCTYNAITDEAQEEVQYTNRYLCFPPCEPPSFMIIVHSNSACQCTTMHSFIKRDGSCTYIGL